MFTYLVGCTNNLPYTKSEIYVDEKEEFKSFVHNGMIEIVGLK